MGGITLRLKLVGLLIFFIISFPFLFTYNADSYQTANSSVNEEWDLRPLFSQLLHSPSIQNSISKMVENILQTSNQVVEVRTKPDAVKMPINYSAPLNEAEKLPALDDDEGL